MPREQKGLRKMEATCSHCVCMGYSAPEGYPRKGEVLEAEIVTFFEISTFGSRITYRNVVTPKYPRIDTQSGIDIGWSYQGGFRQI